MIQKINKTFQFFRNHGAAETLRMVPQYVYAQYIRPKFLYEENIKKVKLYNNIKIPVEISVDNIFPLKNPMDVCHKPDYEYAEVRAIEEYCRENYDVVIVGAGNGVTPVTAANMVGAGGKVVCFEASKRMVERSRLVSRINNVEHIVQIVHAIVEEAKYTWGRTGKCPTVPPSDLPACDFLELDCEGAELDILKKMAIQPRVISVEVHQDHGVHEQEVYQVLLKKGYKLCRETTKKDESIRHFEYVRN